MEMRFYITVWVSRKRWVVARTRHAHDNLHYVVCTRPFKTGWAAAAMADLLEKTPIEKHTDEIKNALLDECLDD